MARGRMINTSVATDKRLATLSLEAEYVYLKTIPHLDRDGLIAADASLLWARVCPRRVDLLPLIDAIVDEWLGQSTIADPFVIAYETTEGRALFFPSFAKNQPGMHYDRELASALPPPPGYRRTAAGLVAESGQPSGSIPEEIRQHSGGNPEELQQPSGSIPEEIPLEVEVKVEVEEVKLLPQPAAAVDNDVLACAQMADRVLGRIPPDLNDIVTRLQAHEHVDWFALALAEAEDAGKKEWRYVKAILNTCLGENRPPGAPKPAGNGYVGSEARRLARGPTTPTTAEARKAKYVPKGYEDIVLS